MKKLIAISITSASITIGAIPALAEVDQKIHKLCLDAKDYSGCVFSNESKKESLSNKVEAQDSELSMKQQCEARGADHEWDGYDCSFRPGNLRGNPEYDSCMEDHSNAGYCTKLVQGGFSGQTVSGNECPPGKSIYQKTALFGLIKGKKLCLTDYEAEALKQRQRQNFSDSMNSLPRVVNCYSNTYGNYTSTSCY